jgi:stearoyl-CoA desaturase (Delta-9 desaturase)
MLASGLVDWPWWGYALAALALTHVTIAAVTIFLHRHQAHRALDLAPLPAHFFRFWLWLTTGMVTREWAAIHRKHHAKCETADDPHSPQVLGLPRVLFAGVLLYVREAKNAETIARYGHGTPDDWLERKVYTPLHKWGIVVMLAIDLTLFGAIPGALVWGVQMVWIPFWAAGVINGVGHYWGYRNFAPGDASTNIVPWGVLIGGEELHNNHHAFASSAKLSNRWYEFDIGWLYIRVLAALGLARVKKVAPTPRLGALRPQVDAGTLQALITHRYDLLARYARSLTTMYRDELTRLADGARFKGLKRCLTSDAALLPQDLRARFDELLARGGALATAYRMRGELSALWERTNATREQLVLDLQDWCRRAEASGIRQLADLSLRLRRYAVA